jgi:hypothetical protein
LIHKLLESRSHELAEEDEERVVPKTLKVWLGKRMCDSAMPLFSFIPILFALVIFVLEGNLNVLVLANPSLSVVKPRPFVAVFQVCAYGLTEWHICTPYKCETIV